MYTAVSTELKGNLLLLWILLNEESLYENKSDTFVFLSHTEIIVKNSAHRDVQAYYMQRQTILTIPSCYRSNNTEKTSSMSNNKVKRMRASATTMSKHNNYFILTLSRN
jgi:hypothetical protein